MSNRLGLRLLSETLDKPDSFDAVARAGVGIVHLGIGAFHRAHQAWYTQRAMQDSGGDWRIVGVSLRSATVASQLNQQDGLYTLIEQDEHGHRATLMNVIDHVLVAPESPLPVLEQLCRESIKCVTLTITEKGYYHDPASGQLQTDHSDIVHDIQNPKSPKTAIGFIVRAIEFRLKNGLSPFTVLSCDNLPANGDLLKGLVLEFAGLIASDLANQIAETYCFPCSMVDRIVPAMTPETRQHLSDLIGYEDQGLIATEPYSCWVVEDNFCNSRPAWEQAGVTFVDNVHDFETMKLRLLNGSHSAIAYVGFLAGFETVADAIADDQIAQLIQRLMKDELMPGVKVGGQIDLNDYCAELVARFRNTTLQHKTYQIAMDGSQKLPQRLIAPLSYQRQNNGPTDCICFVLAAWIQYTSGFRLNGETITVQDPMAESLHAKFIANDKNNESWVKDVFNTQEIFTAEIGHDEQIIRHVSHWLELMREDRSMAKTLQRLLQEISS